MLLWGRYSPDAGRTTHVYPATEPTRHDLSARRECACGATVEQMCSGCCYEGCERCGGTGVMGSYDPDRGAIVIHVPAGPDPHPSLN